VRPEEIAPAEEEADCAVWSSGLPPERIPVNSYALIDEAPLKLG
jgi:hypothetical protein